MGTDIFPFIEVRKDGQWLEHWPRRQAADPSLQDSFEGRNEIDRYVGALPDAITARHYLKFAVLADVRNIETVVPVPPISSRRGAPPDLSPGAGLTWLKRSTTQDT